MSRRHRRPGELRCDSETAARASSLEQTIPSFRLYETGVPSATSRTVLEDAWIALAGFEGRQHNDTAHADGSSSTHSHSGQEVFPGMTISYALLQTIEKMSEKPDKVKTITKARVRS